MINVSADGHYTPSAVNERFDVSAGEEDPKVYAEHLDRIFERIREMPVNPQTGKRRILVYVHGGLNWHQHALDRVVSQYSPMHEVGTYPIFINWRSFFTTTYSEHLLRIREGQPSKLAPVTAPVYFLTDLGRAVAMMPRTLIKQGTHLLNKFRERGVKVAWYLMGADVPEGKVNPEHDFITYVPSRSSQRFSGPGWILWSIIMSPLKWVEAPFLSDLGRPAWEMMQRRTNTLFRKPDEFSLTNCAEIESDSLMQQRCRSGTGALADFVEKLDLFLKSEGGTGHDNGDYEVVLIGHSMGTIVLNKWLTAFPDLHVDHLVYMASASSTRQVVTHVVPYLQDHPHTQFYSLMMHPDNDNSELHFWGITPSGSLLVWVDNFLTTPQTELDRTFGRWENVRSALHVFPKEMLQSGQIRFKIFGFDEENSPQFHGDFDRFPYWEPNFWWKGPWEWQGKYYSGADPSDSSAH